jgi:transglutaminase-like putative cysteine protease
LGRTSVERAVRVFKFVRDDIAYDFLAKLTPQEYEASYTLRAGKGFCTQKAVLLAALGRAAGIPTALVLTDLRDDSLPDRVIRAMGGSNLFEYHGLVAFHLDGQWVKADATLSPDVVRRRRYRPVEFDGREDALLADTTLEGKPHIRYESVRGVYADLPFDEMVRVLKERFQRIDVEALAAIRYKM